MSHAGWLDVWNLVLTLVGREPPVIAILYWLAFAFALLMIAEGLRANFFPFRPVGPRTPKQASEPASTPQVMADIGDAAPTTAFSVSTAKFAPRPLARNAKRRIISLRRQTPPKPQIRRMPKTVEPPQSGLIDVTSVFEPVMTEAAPAELHHLTALPPDAFAVAAVQAANVA